jgi:uncharacterized protein DUF1161
MLAAGPQFIKGDPAMKSWIAIAAVLAVPACSFAQAAPSAQTAPATPSAPAAQGPKACEDLKSEIAAKLDAKGVKSYTLDIVDKDKEATDGKAVGTCDGGTKKIIYKRGAAAAAPATPAAPAKEPSKP